MRILKQLNAQGQQLLIGLIWRLDMLCQTRAFVTVALALEDP